MTLPSRKGVVMSDQVCTETGCPDTGLEGLMARGFQFVHPKDENGQVLAVRGFLAHDGVIDVVHLYAEDDAFAFRVPNDERDLISPKNTMWCSRGPARDVLEELLTLPRRHQVLWYPGLAGAHAHAG